MKVTRRLRWILLAGALLIAFAAPFLLDLYEEGRKVISEDPRVWEKDIARLEKQASLRPTGTHPVVFIGSSSIRMWASLEEDMHPIPVVQQGFGGAKLNDIVHYADRLINPHKPAAVVVFAGTNDIHPGATKTPATLLKSYKTFVHAVRSENGRLPIFYIAITPSPMRWEVWDIAKRTNELIKTFSRQDPDLHVIDTAPALLEDGRPKRNHYIFDGLHLSKKGYAAWTSMIRPRLLSELPMLAHPSI